MTVVAIDHRSDGRARLGACIAKVAMADDDRLSVFEVQVAEGAQIINLGLLPKQDVVDRFAEIAESAGLVREFGPDDVQKAMSAFGNVGTALPAAKALAFISAASLADQPIPVRGWHVEGLIPAENVTLLNGDGGTGKSLVALQLSVATVLARPWLGRTVRPGRCLFLTAEDDIAEIHRRLADIVCEEGASLADLGDLMIVSLAGEDALLAVPDGRSNLVRPTALYDALESLIERSAPALIVLDTLADLFGGEENQRAQARQFIGALRGLALRYHAALLLLAHPSLSGMASGSGSSGSTGWNNSVRSRLYLERIKGADGAEDDPDARVLKTMKANYSATGSQIRMRWRGGVFVTDGEATVNSFATIAAEARAERLFLDLVAKYTAEGRHVSATASPNYAPAIFEKDHRSDGIKKRGFATAMNRLFETKQIKIDEFGPPSRRLKRIILASPEAAE